MQAQSSVYWGGWVYIVVPSHNAHVGGAWGRGYIGQARSITRHW